MKVKTTAPSTAHSFSRAEFYTWTRAQSKRTRQLDIIRAHTITGGMHGADTPLPTQRRKCRDCTTSTPETGGRLQALKAWQQLLWHALSDRAVSYTPPCHAHPCAPERTNRRPPFAHLLNDDAMPRLQAKLLMTDTSQLALSRKRWDDPLHKDWVLEFAMGGQRTSPCSSVYCGPRHTRQVSCVE